MHVKIFLLSFMTTAHVKSIFKVTAWTFSAQYFLDTTDIKLYTAKFIVLTYCSCEGKQDIILFNVERYDPSIHKHPALLFETLHVKTQHITLMHIKVFQQKRKWLN